MERLMDKLVILMLGTLALLQTTGFNRPVLVFFVTLAITCFTSYCSTEDPHNRCGTDNLKQSTSRKYVVCGLMLLSLILCVIEPGFPFFLPLLCYDAVWFGNWWGLAGVLLAVVEHDVFSNGMQAAVWGIALVLAVILAWRTGRQLKMKGDYIRLRDTSTELRLVMQEKNKELMEKQDYEIHLATLQERNRIAREIHDNVGHLLTRTILQMGALTTIYKQEPLNGQLASINDTMNQAMTSIRESVHDLHDDSIDLQQSILEATKEMEESYKLKVEFDISNQVEKRIKYCFITIVKEAMANIVKHSDADQIQVILREHPGIFQMSIEDNGHPKLVDSTELGAGLGLSNMRERVENLGGTIHFDTERGFKIFVSIPKKTQ